MPENQPAVVQEASARLEQLIAKWREKQSFRGIRFRVSTIQLRCADELETLLPALQASETQRHALTAENERLRMERDEYRTLSGIGVWHKDCRPNREMAARELQKSQEVINRLADTVSELRALLASSPAGTSIAIESHHGNSTQTVVGGTNQANDNAVSSPVRPHEHEGLQQRPGNQAVRASGVHDDGELVEQREGGSPRNVPEVCQAQTPTIDGEWASSPAGTPKERYACFRCCDEAGVVPYRERHITHEVGEPCPKAAGTPKE